MASNIDSKLENIQNKVEEVSDTVHKIDKDLAIHKATFDDHLKQDERMYEEFKRMNDILQQNTESLKEHMHRTDLLEQLVQHMDSRLNPIEIERLEKETIKKYRKEKLVMLAKVLGIIATIVAILAGIKGL